MAQAAGLDGDIVPSPLSRPRALPCIVSHRVEVFIAVHSSVRLTGLNSTASYHTKTLPSVYHSVLEHLGLAISALARVEAEPSISVFALCDAARGLLLALRQVQAGHKPRIWKPPSVLWEGPRLSQSQIMPCRVFASSEPAGP